MYLLCYRRIVCIIASTKYNTNVDDVIRFTQNITCPNLIRLYVVTTGVDFPRKGTDTYTVMHNRIYMLLHDMLIVQHTNAGPFYYKLCTWWQCYLRNLCCMLTTAFSYNRKGTMYVTGITVIQHIFLMTVYLYWTLHNIKLESP